MIYSAQTIRDIESYTIKNQKISSIELMERAANSFLKEFITRYAEYYHFEIVIFCGAGNNGGDGLAIARLLSNNNFQVRVILCQQSAVPSPDCASNLTRLSNEKNVTIEDFNEELIFSKTSIAIDALFGIGLNKPLSTYYQKIISTINESFLTIISVDLASGLFADFYTHEQNHVVKPTATFTFQYPKLCFYFPENDEYAQGINILDIGLKTNNDHKPTCYLFSNKNAKLIFQPVTKHTHKGTNGTGLLIAGSAQMPGAACLAAKAALRAGIGKLVLHAPNKVLENAIHFSPEIILQKDKNQNHFSELSMNIVTKHIAIGCGLGTHIDTQRAFLELLTNQNSPMIIDADALNILAENKNWIEKIPESSILTPHYKEFDRFAGNSENSYQRLEKLKHFANENKVIVILKGHYSAIAFPNGKIFFNTSGNQGMATAGSGDVLTGILLACLAKGYTPENAALFGTFLHGLAGDCALKSQSFESLIASDIIENLGNAFKIISH